MPLMIRPAKSPNDSHCKHGYPLFLQHAFNFLFFLQHSRQLFIALFFLFIQLLLQFLKPDADILQLINLKQQIDACRMGGKTKQ